MDNLPSYLAPLFLLTAALAIWLFVKASSSKIITAVILIAWGTSWYFIARTGFFLDLQAMPPKIIFMMAPVILVMILFFATKQGRAAIDRMDLRALTLVHIVRLPVEIILMILAIYKTIPTLLTFEGRNFDIIMGLTTLPMVWLIFKANKSKKLLLWWNISGIFLLLNVVIHGVLSLPLQFQQLAFDQPNVAMLCQPYNLLPGLIVPIVMFSHLASIRLLIKSA